MEFASKYTAKTVADCMNNYLMFHRLLKCKCVCVCVSSFICVFEVVELIFTIGVMEKYVERQICSKK